MNLPNFFLHIRDDSFDLRVSCNVLCYQPGLAESNYNNLWPLNNTILAKRLSVHLLSDDVLKISFYMVQDNLTR